MARPQKKGLDYFSLDVQMNDEIEVLEAKYKLEGFAIIIKLFQKIYSKGYYLEWNEKEQLLFSNRVSADENFVASVVSDAVKWGIFNQEKLEKYGILTSRRIQEQYFAAVYKRAEVEAIKEYLLIDLSNKANVKVVTLSGEVVSDVRNKNVSRVSDVRNDVTTHVSDVKSTQSKENNKDIYSQELEEVFQVWVDQEQLVKHKKITEKMRTKYKSARKDYTKEEIIEAIRNYNDILASDQHFFSYRWNLDEFLARGIGKFVNREIAWGNFLKNEYKSENKNATIMRIDQAKEPAVGSKALQRFIQQQLTKAARMS